MKLEPKNAARSDIGNPSSILKAIFYRFSLQIIAFPVTFAASVYFMRFLGPERVGMYRMGFSTLVVFFVFTSNLGLNTVLTKAIAELNAKDPLMVKPVWNAFLRHRLLLTLALGALCWFGSDYIAAVFLRDKALGLFLKTGAFFVAANSLRTLYGSIFIGLGRVNVQSTTAFLAESGGSVVTAAIVFFGCETLHIILAGVVGVEAVCLAYYILLLSLYASKNLPRDGAVDKKAVSAQYRSGVKLSGHIAFISLTALTFGHFDILILGKLREPAEVGVFAAALSISIFPMKIPISIEGVLLPVYSDYWAKGKRDVIERLTGAICHMCLVIFLPMTVGFIVLAKPMIIHLYGAEYSSSASVLSVLGALVLVKTTFFIQYPLFTSMNRAGFVTLHNTISNVMYIALILLLVPKMGAQGMAISMIVSFAYNSAALMGGYLREFKLPLPGGKIIRLALANLLYCLFLLAAKSHITSLATLLAALLTSSLLYIILLFAIGAFTMKDWKKLAGDGKTR